LNKEPVDSSSCPLVGCRYRDDCAVIGITGKVPKPGSKCSYFEDEKSSRSKKAKKSEKEEDDKEL